MEEQQPPSGAAPSGAPRGRAVWIAVAVVVVVVVVLLAAVLGGLFAPPAPDRLRIGVLLSFSGSLDDFGPGNYRGALLAVEEINLAGGVLGKPIELSVEDDQTSPTAAAAAATKLITNDRVTAIIGAQFSGGSIAALTIARGSGVPLVSPSATSPSLSNQSLTGGWFFRVTPNDNLQGVVAAQYLYNNLSYRYVNIMNINDPYGNGLAGAVRAKFIALGGTVNTTVPINPKSTDFTADLTTLFQTNPQAVYFIAFTDEGTTVMKQWQAGKGTRPAWDRPWIFAEGLKSQQLMDDLRDPSVGVDVTKIIGTAPVSGVAPLYASFETRYRARHNNETPVQYTDFAYDAAYLIATAAQKAGKFDGASIRAQLRAIASPPGTIVRPNQWNDTEAAIAAGQDLDWEGAAGAENIDEFGDVTGPYEIWGVDSATLRLKRVAFYPESLIQVSPPISSGPEYVPRLNGFLTQVQAIAFSRWD